MLPTKAIKYDILAPEQNLFYWDAWMDNRNPNLGQDTVQVLFQEWEAGRVAIILPVNVVWKWQTGIIKNWQKEEVAKCSI